MLDTLLQWIVGYYVVLHLTYGVLIIVGVSELRRYGRGVRPGEFEAIAASPVGLPISMIVPAYNEEKIIVSTVQNLLQLRYPRHEVIVVSDGSSDATTSVLISHFGLTPVRRDDAWTLPTATVRGIYASPLLPNLVVVDKANGRRADAINMGANLARHPLLFIMDADCVLEQDALLRSVRPFLRDDNVIAAGGVVRPANGLVVQDGRIQSAALPRRLLPLIQAIEYLRSFQWARLGLARLGSMLSISGAFMLVRKAVFLEMGGVNPGTITDDIEFTLRLYRYVHEHTGPRLSVRYIPDAVCYTEVPESHRVYAAQRNRWQRGTLQALMWHKRVTFNPRYGATGLFGMPFFFIFEAFSVIVEGAGYVLLAYLLISGHWSWENVAWTLALFIVLGMVLSVSAVMLQETTRLRAASWGDVGCLVAAALVENFGYHQLHLLWRVVGTFDYLVRRRTDLGLMERYGSYQKAAGS